MGGFPHCLALITPLDHCPPILDNKIPTFSRLFPDLMINFPDLFFTYMEEGNDTLEQQCMPILQQISRQLIFF